MKGKRLERNWQRRSRSNHGLLFFFKYLIILLYCSVVCGGFVYMYIFNISMVNVIVKSEATTRTRLQYIAPLHFHATPLSRHPIVTHPIVTPPHCHATPLSRHSISMPPHCHATPLSRHPIVTPPHFHATPLSRHPIATPPHCCATPCHATSCHNIPVQYHMSHHATPFQCNITCHITSCRLMLMPHAVDYHAALCRVMPCYAAPCHSTEIRN